MKSLDVLRWLGVHSRYLSIKEAPFHLNVVHRLDTELNSI